MALLLFTMGYWVIGALSPAVAALPAFVAFLAAGRLLTPRAGPPRRPARR